MPRYRIEHHSDETIDLIAIGVQPLTPLAASLASHGKTGDVVVIDVDTGKVIIRVPIAPPDPPVPQDNR